ncbi:response regulator [Nostoc sp. UHCC 0302]|uniref:response regulator n=1 Tax=Nostoc sp. UHCC 0302 TaxID=3134896 RepID=UPI00311C9042
MKILVVEDDELNAYVLTAVLTNQNYAVEIAADGDTAWDLIQTYTYDLILLDVILPKLDGISLCRKIRSNGLQVPILLLTGRDSSHDKAIGLDAGADDYVVKPFEEEELVARVRALLRRPGVTSQPVLEWAGLRLDPSSCEVTYAGNLLSLTPKEYALLELFLRNSRRVFSCGVILEHLWSYDDTPGEEAVRTHIKGLRQKLKAVGISSDLIETVYGIGYRLKPLEEEGEQGSILLYERLRQRLRSATGRAEGQGGKELNDLKSTVPNLKLEQQQTLAAVSDIWQRFKGRVGDQVSVLEQAVVALNQKTLNPELRLQATQEAHTLAGSLGTFGFGLASKLARKIEHLLNSNKTLSPSNLVNFESWVKLLRQEIEGESNVAAISAQPTAEELPNAPYAEAKILIVDDDPKIQALLQILLQPWGFKAIALEDPRQFWETLETVTPDLLILDVELPYTNGIELCKLVRNNSHWSELPILFLTVHSDAEIVNQVFSVGADDFVSKPIIGPELVTRILNRLERIKLRQRITQTRERLRGEQGDSGQGGREQGGQGGQGGIIEEVFPSALSSSNCRTILDAEAEICRLNRMLEIYGIVAFRNQRDRQLAETALKESKASYQQLVELCPEVIFIASDGKFVFLNSTAVELLGATHPNQLLGKKVLDLVYPNSQAAFSDRLQYIRETNQAIPLNEQQFLRLDGTVIDLEIVAAPFNYHGNPAVQVVARDITKRKQTEAALHRANSQLELRVAERTAELITVNQQLQLELDERQRTQEELRFSQARFARILDIADDAIISIDGLQRITLFNQGAEKIFGYSAPEVIGKGLDLLLPLRFAEAHRHHVVDFSKSPSPARRMGERQEIYGRRKDGSEFPAEASISKLEINEEIFYTVILRDITDRKLIERMKDEFVSVVSHELRTPLTSIHGSLGMLTSGLLPTDSEQGKRLLQIATDSTERLVRLINDILDIERIESGKAKMQPEICNIADLIAQAVNVMQPLADKAGVTLSISTLSMQLCVDPDRIVQTLTNLLSNAIKFSSAGSTVWLMAQQQADQVLFTVQDTGRGIPTDKLESIFERFQQVDSSDSRNHDGTGLGLAICKSIVQQHGGHIWVESLLGKGSNFYFTLPILGL